MVTEPHVFEVHDALVEAELSSVSKETLSAVAKRRRRGGGR